MARELDEDEKQFLTPEELAAMEEEGAEDLDVKLPEKDDEENPLDIETKDDGKAGSDDATMPPAAAAEAAPVAEPPAFEPKFTDADQAALDVIAAKRAEVTTQADDGELSFAEAQAKLKSLDEEAAPIQRRQVEDDVRRDFIERQNEAAWGAAVNKFLTDSKVDPAKITDEHWKKLDDISVALTGNPALIAGMSMGRQVQEVFRLFDAQHPGAWGGAKPWEGEKPAPRAEPKADDPKAKNEVQVPPTLGGLPTSDNGPGVEDCGSAWNVDPVRPGIGVED